VCHASDALQSAAEAALRGDLNRLTVNQRPKTFDQNGGVSERVVHFALVLRATVGPVRGASWRLPEPIQIRC